MTETALPFSAFREILDFLPRGHHIRVMLLMAALTGCRLTELEHMRWENLNDGVMYWHKGKNQKGYRGVPLPKWFQRELVYYQDSFPTPKGMIFSKKARTLRRLFDRDVRPYLNKKWRERAFKPCSKGCVRQKPYILQLKGLRKSYTTTIFYRNWKKYGDCTAGILMASAELGHSSEHITAHHYLKELDTLELTAWERFLKAEIEPHAQTRIYEWIAESLKGELGFS